ncbi:hypothetical protein [Hymenobacter cellulosivorans]|uniref:Uncharacterized protein n=1 Tax=Hymenobacter cellulosivorans TaxID=2932249 RepID=A0ABY4F8S1_9BACT|nr:hypothetical protein [Hymenobacter cellulosivorans]UOQ53064.1 hypothetical protein MUN80_25420 [Hymenobacter cellulosivorans]
MLASAKAAFAKAGPELVAATIEALKQHPQPPRNRPAYTSGRTAQAVHAEATDESLTLFGPAHLQALITGRGPTQQQGGGTGEPLHTILEQWAQDKGIILSGGMTYRQFGFAAAQKIHASGTELYRHTQVSGLLDDVLSPTILNTLLASIAAGEQVAIASALRGVSTL